MLCALDEGEAMFHESREVPERHRSARRDRDPPAGNGHHAFIFKPKNVSDLSGRHDAERIIAPALIDGSAGYGECSGDSCVDGNAFLASASLQCGGLFWREFHSFYIGQGGRSAAKDIRRARWNCAVAPPRRISRDGASGRGSKTCPLRTRRMPRRRKIREIPSETA
jgi:hypothetical protein